MLALFFALLCGVATLILGTVGSVKLLIVLFGALGLLVVMMLARDQRLLLLWLLVFCIPIAYSKQFGEIVYKGGGEQAFSLAPYDVFVVWLLCYQLRDLFLNRGQWNSNSETALGLDCDYCVRHYSYCHWTLAYLWSARSPAHE